MDSEGFKYGFRILGKTCEPRRLVDAGAAFAAYATCDPRAATDREGYLSAFLFGQEFADHLKATGSTAGFNGPCWCPWLWFDFDSEDDPAHAQADAAALVEHLQENEIDPAGLLIFYSGSKGFHLGLPTALWAPPPGIGFHQTARRFAERLGEAAAVTIDAGVYDKVRAFRAPNSRHPKTGLHKRRLTLDELGGPIGAILDLAATPSPFEVPPPPTVKSDWLAGLWTDAAETVRQQTEAATAHRIETGDAPKLNRSTVEFMREGVAAGDRHRRLFSAAANLAEFGCPPALAFALLEESALDMGLPPKDVRRGIECGLGAVASAMPSESTPPEAAQSTQDRQDDRESVKPPEAAIDDPGAIGGQPCQQVTPAPTAAALASLWGHPAQERAKGPTLTPSIETTTTSPVVTSTVATARTPLPADPPRLPAGAIATGVSSTAACTRCGGRGYNEFLLTDNRTRRDCAKCGRFMEFTGWTQ